MKLIIIPEDGMVQIDNENLIVETKSAPKDIHALEWNTGFLESGDDKGEVEYKANENGQKPDNKIITKLPAWTTKYIKDWEKVKENYEREMELLEIEPDDVPEPMIPEEFNEIYSLDDIKE